MWTLILKRLISIPPLLLVISLLTYLLMQAASGDFYQRLEENPQYAQDYVMALRLSAGKVVEIAPEQRARRLASFELGGHTYSFDTEGNLLRDGETANTRREQDVLKRFVWPEPDGDQFTITEEGRVYRWVGPIRGYFAWLGNVLSGDLGQSFNYQDSVASVILDRLLNTLLLSSVALMMAWGMAIPLGVWSGVKPNSLIDHVCGFIAYFGLSIPRVFLALLAVLFAAYTGWFPIGNMRDNVNWDDMTRSEQWIDVAWHTMLPASVIAFTTLAGYMRQMRGQMVETMSADYVRTARAKGVPERRVMFRHALRNAINPLVTLFGFSLAALLSGSVLVEIVMNWPGLARVVVDAVFARDEPIVMAAVMMGTIMLIVGNLVADILLGLVDPRIRVG